jgi:protein ImuB
VSRYLSLHIAAKKSPEALTLTPARLADWCRRFTPLAAPDAPDGAMLDIAGAAHLFGGEEALAQKIETRLATLGFEARCALADTPEAAWALARFSRLRAVPTGADEKQLRRLLGDLPVAALRISTDKAYALSQTGLKRVDDLWMRPRAPIAARFGEEIFRRLDGLMGKLRTPITPRFEAPLYVVERNFAEPIGRREDVESVLATLAQDLCRLLERHGEGARRVEANLFRTDGLVRHIEIASSRPLRDPQAISLLLRERIKAAAERGDEDPLDSGFGFDLMRLAALHVEELNPAQDSWTRVVVPLQEKGAELIDRLGARLGAHRVQRLAPNPTHWPDHAARFVTAATAPAIDWDTEPQLPRPIRVFERPEPVEAIAEVPDGPPLRFKWRRVMHEVVSIEGPERIAPEWWAQQAPQLTRDYFRVEDKEGRRFWMFREGLYGEEAPRPGWFLHGVFA